MSQNTESEIKPPFYKVGEWYEITVNPDDNHQFINDEFRFRKVVDYITIVASHMHAQEIVMKLYPEISEIQHLIDGKYPRIHFHGKIKFNSKKALQKFLLKYSLCLSKFSSVQINNYRKEYWDKYCVKQSDIMQDLTTSENYVYPLVFSKPRETPSFIFPESIVKRKKDKSKAKDVRKVESENDNDDRLSD